MARRILIHLPRHMVEELSDNRPHFYTKLRATLQGAGAQAEIIDRLPGNPVPDPDDGDFHFIHQSSHRQPNVLNTGLAYVAPFWYADPQGIYGDSSVTHAQFDPAAVPRAEADGFHARLYKRLATARQSRYGQPEAVEVFPKGCIAVFLQGVSDLLARSAHVTTRAMVEAVVAHSDGRPVVVKPHPRDADPDALDWLHRLAGNGALRVTRANIHDILAAAAVTVSVNSAVALEGMIHTRPAVLFGRSDLHHNAVTVADVSAWPEALDQALSQEWPHAQFLHWFLLGAMLNTGHDSFAPRLLARIPQRAAFGLG
jgi:hypothetical protein